MRLASNLLRPASLLPEPINRMPRTRGGSSFETPREVLNFNRYYNNICTKDVISSPVLDFDLKEEMGIRQEFERLTQ